MRLNSYTKLKKRLPLVTWHFDHFKPSSTEDATLTEDKKDPWETQIFEVGKSYFTNENVIVSCEQA